MNDKSALHITNGDSVVQGFRQGSIGGTYLPWLDALHDGPVPQVDTLAELSDVRARALSEFGWGTLQGIRAAFAARDRAIAGFRDYHEVVLWFEHDLFDQLQLVQVLAWLATHDLAGTRLSLIQIDNHPGIVPFYGLGQLTGDQLAQLLPARATVTQEQMLTATEAWHAFTAADPAALAAFVHRDTAALPFLAAALRRFCEEYPAAGDGLSRTQRQLLRAAGAGAATKRELYLRSRTEESSPWGDLSIYLRIDGLAAAPAPALSLVDDRYAITDVGRRLLSGEADWTTLRGGVDAWLGGVHLHGQSPDWRWDRVRAELVKA